MQLDISRMGFPDDYLPRMEPAIQKAFHSMALLEAGVVANPDENRMVGHYWLRSPDRSPSPEIQREIEHTVKAILNLFMPFTRVRSNRRSARVLPACFASVSVALHSARSLYLMPLVLP